MGVYWYGVSRRTVEIDGHTMIRGLFFGKAPDRFSYWMDQKRWTTFKTRCNNNADVHWVIKPKPKFMLLGDKPGVDEAVMLWDGLPYFSDSTDSFGERYVGSLYKDGRKWRVKWNKRGEEFALRILAGDVQ